MCHFGTGLHPHDLPNRTDILVAVSVFSMLDMQPWPLVFCRVKALPFATPESNRNK
jgi:hypothetical protein